MRHSDFGKFSWCEGADAGICASRSTELPAFPRHVKLGISDRSGPRRLNEWLGFFRPLEQVQSLGPQARRLEIDAWATDTMFAGRICASAMDLTRARARPVTNAGRIVALRFLDGPAFLRFGRSIRVLAPGDLQILDCASCSSLSTTGGGMEAVAVTRRDLGLPPILLPRHRTITDGRKVGRGAAERLTALLSELSSATAQGCLDELKTGLRELLTTGAAEPTRATDRDTRMRAFAQDNALLSSFQPADLCREFGVSRATIYRAFEAHGGVHAYVTRHRLNAAMVQLWKERPGRGVITRVARAHGFEDIYHFSRSIRRTFGISPSEVLALHASAMTLGDCS